MGLREAALTGFRFQLYLKVFSVLFYQIASVVLAILLVPSDFAIVGLGLVFVGFALSISDFGMGTAVIQDSSDDRSVISTAASLRLMTAAMFAAAVFVSAPYVAGFYDEPRLTEVIRILSLLFVLSFAGFVSRVALTKDLQFRKLFIPEVLGSVSATLASLAFALADWGYWSLVLGYLVGSMVTVLVLYAVRPWKLTLMIDTGVAVRILRFGSPLVAGSVLAFLFQNAGVLILGAFSFPEVGYFVFAYGWTVSLSMSAHTTIDNVMFPVFSAMNVDPGRVRKSYLALLKYLAWAIIPAGGFVAAAAPSVVVSLVGPKWIPAVPIMQILALAGVSLVLSQSYVGAAVALGRPREMLAYNGIAVLVMAPAALALIQVSGGPGLAIAFLVTGTAMLVWGVIRLEQVFGGVRWDFAATLGPPTLASFAFALPLALLQNWIPSSLPLLILQALTALLLYVAIMSILTKHRFVREARELASTVFRRQAP